MSHQPKGAYIVLSLPLPLSVHLFTLPVRLLLGHLFWFSGHIIILFLLLDLFLDIPSEFLLHFFFLGVLFKGTLCSNTTSDHMGAYRAAVLMVRQYPFVPLVGHVASSYAGG